MSGERSIQTRLARFTIRHPQQQLLVAVATFPYTSASQLTRLLYAPTSLKYVRERLKELRQHGYLRATLVPTLPKEGKSPYLYLLDRKGHAYVKKLGLAASGRFAPSEQAEREWLFLRHTIAANDLMIQSHLIQAADPTVTLVTFLTEPQLKRSPGYVMIGTRKIPVIPDGWVHLQKTWPGRTRPSEYYIAWELDRGTLQRARFRKKVRALVSWIEKGYVDQFGVAGLTVAVVTTASGARLREMLTWTEDELSVLRAQGYGELFLFAAFDPSQLAPEQLFLTPIWHQPFQSHPVCLFEPP